jgi:hypothetical protein
MACFSSLIDDFQKDAEDLLLNQDNAAIDAYLDQTADALDAVLASVSGASREHELLSLLGVIANE